MSNQIVISSGAKVRSLEGVLTGSAGIVSSVPLGGANGVATLDSSGKVPLSQLPASVITYLGTWDAATNTPTLTNGTGDDGDLYICNVAGTVNFGAGPITFAVGDWVIYGSGTWQKSAGQNGTVTSVAVTESGDALTITGSPITTAGTINIGFAGNSGQYINGEGNLTTFPSLITEAQNLVTEVYNETGSTLTKGTIVYINGGHGNLPTVTKAIATGDSTSAQTYGVVRADISNNNNGYVTVIGSLSDIDTQAYAAGTQLYLSGTTAGAWTSTKPSAPIHLVYVGIVVRSHPTQGVIEIRIQNGYELEELHDVAISSPLNNQGIFYNSSTDLWENKSIDTALGYTPANAATYVPYTGATTSVNLGGYNLTGYTLNGNQGLKVEGYGGEGGYLAFKQYAVNNLLGSGYTSISANSTNILSFLFAQSAPYDAKQFKIDVAGLTTNVWRTYTMPDADGTLALTSDIPSLSGYVPYTGATSNVDLGSHNLTTTGDLFVGSVTAGGIFAETNVGGEGYIYLKGNGTFGILSIYNSIFANGYKYGFDVQGGTTGAAKRAYLDFGSLTNSTTRTYSFPDASGTLALTSDIPSLSNYVTLTGAQTITGIKTFSNEQLFGNGITLTGGYITYTSGSYNLTLNTNILTANRNIFLQDGSGTLAFTSDIPSLSGYVQGSGTTNYHAKFTAGSTIGNSMLTDDGTTLQSIGATRSNLYLKAASSSYYGQLAFTNGSNGSFGGISYNNSGQYMQFETNSSEWMRLTSDGQLGLGSTSPANYFSRTLTIDGSSSQGIMFRASGTDKGFIYQDGSFIQIGSNAGGVIFKSSDTERMRITSSGNIGIGTSSPSVLLDINTGALANNGYNGMRIADDVAHYWFLARKDGSGNRRMAIYNGQNAYPLTLQEGGGGVAIGTISNYGRTLYVLGATSNSSAWNSTFDNSSGGTIIGFRNDGLISTGGTLPYSPYNLTITPGRIVYVDSSGTLGYVASIRESKTNINPLGSVEWVKNLNPVSFNYRKKDENNQYTDEFSDDVFYGLIADEVEKIDSNLVFYDVKENGEKELKGVYYEKLTAVLIKAIQELSAKVTALENKLN